MQRDASAKSNEELIAFLAGLDAAASALDVERFVDHLVDGPNLAWTFNGRLCTRLADVRELHVASWSKLGSANFRTGTPRVVMLAPGIAALSAVGQSQRVFLNGESGSGQYAITLIVVRKPEGWRIVQGHESTPVSQT